MIRRLPALVAIATVLGAGPVVAQPNACADAHTEGQKLLKERRFLEARDRFRLCAVESCSKIYKADCTTFLEEVRTRLPTVVLSATSANQSLTDVTVSMDGKPLASQLDGKAIEVDPGPHDFTFTRTGQPPLVVKRIITEAKQGQDVSVTFVDAPKVDGAPKSTTSPPTSFPSSPPPKVTDTPTRIGTIVGFALAGVGLGLGVTGVVLASSGASKFNQANDACGALPESYPDCRPGGTLAADKDAGKSRRTLGLVLLGGGVALLGTGVVVLVTGRPAEATTLSVGPGTLVLTGRF